MRETQKEGKKLALMNKYKRSVVRVQLPDRFVIQAVFLPGANLTEVMENLKRYLNVQDNLELFTTPPKTVLDLNRNLLDHELVPAALVYLASKNSSNNSSDTSMISNEVLEKLSNSSGAELALSEAGILKTNTDSKQNSSDSQHIISSQNLVSNSTSSDSASNSSDAAMKRPPTTNLTGGKVPKWLKSSKQ